MFGQEQVPETTTVNFFAVFDFATFTVALPAGSFRPREFGLGLDAVASWSIHAVS